MVLDGKELEGKIGSVGQYSADLNEKGELEVSVGVKIDLIAEIEKLAAKSETKIDDAVLGFLKKLVGRV